MQPRVFPEKVRRSGTLRGLRRNSSQSAPLNTTQPIGAYPAAKHFPPITMSGSSAAEYTPTPVRPKAVTTSSIIRMMPRRATQPDKIGQILSALYHAPARGSSDRLDNNCGYTLCPEPIEQAADGLNVRGLVDFWPAEVEFSGFNLVIG